MEKQADEVSFIHISIFIQLQSMTPPSNDQLGDKDPDLYDILDAWRDHKLEKKKEKYEAEGLSKEEIDKKIKQDDLEQEKELNAQRTFFAGAPFLGYNPTQAYL